MGKAKYNAKARKVIKTNIDNSETNEVLSNNNKDTIFNKFYQFNHIIYRCKS